MPLEGSTWLGRWGKTLRAEPIFFLLLALHLAFPFATHFFPTLDGPAHLHNAQLLKELLLGNDVVRSTFSSHPLPVPNWLDHAFLAALLVVLPAWLAEKALVLLYIAGMALGFRRLLQVLAPERVMLAPIVFPLIHGCLFNMGFLNFSLGILILFWIVAHGVVYLGQPDRKHYLVLIALATAMYFANVLAFALAAFVLGCAALQHAHRLGGAVRDRIRTMVLLGTAFVPGLVCFALFQADVVFGAPDPPRPTQELIQWLLTARPLVWYDYEAEGAIARWFPILLGVLLLGRVLHRAPMTWRTFIFIPALLVLLVLYFTTPDSAQAGMMSDRYALLILLVFTIQAALIAAPRWPAIVVNVAAGTLSIALGYVQWTQGRGPLDQHSRDIHQLAVQVPDNSTVYPVNLSDNWLEAHLSNYLGVDKPLIILENYEARLGWFPLRWKSGWTPPPCLGANIPYGVRCTPEAVDRPAVGMYVLVYGDHQRLQDPSHGELLRILERDFHRMHTSPDGFATLYAPNHPR